MPAERKIAASACGIVALLQDVFGFSYTASFVVCCVVFCRLFDKTVDRHPKLANIIGLVSLEQNLFFFSRLSMIEWVLQHFMQTDSLELVQRSTSDSPGGPRRCPEVLGGKSEIARRCQILPGGCPEVMLQWSHARAKMATKS